MLNRHLEADPRTLDPSLATDVVGFDVLEDLFEGLVTLRRRTERFPAWRLRGTPAPTARPGHFTCEKKRNGPTAQPVTADDFVYAWRRQVDPATASEYSQALAPIENALDIAAGKMPLDKLGVESAGPHTLIVHLHTPTAYLLALLTNGYLYPLYEAAVKQWGDAWTQPGTWSRTARFCSRIA